MKLIGTELGKVVVLMTPEEWRPTKLSTADAFKAIKERYQFAYAPNLSIPWDALQKDGFKFHIGRLKSGDNDLPIQEFTLYNDGIVINANNTDDAEAFLTDISRWAKESAGTRDLTNTGRRLFVSSVVVEFEHSVNKIIRGFQDISKVIEKSMQATYNSHFPIEVRTMAFHYDQLSLPEWIKVTYFSIDRRIGHKYDENRFFCEAPLRTPDHLQALEAIEQLFK